MSEPKMLNFAIYKIHFYVDREKTIYNHDKNAEQYLEHAEECMLSLFDENTVKSLYKYRKDKEPIIYPNDVMCPVRWNVVWWRVNNVQFKKFVKRVGNDYAGRGIYEEDTQESNPYTNVVLDLRPDSLQIAIEETPAWGNTDNLCKVMKESFKRLLSDGFGLNIEIEPKMEPTKFWDYVNKRIFDDNDYVRKMSFTFANAKRLKGIAPGNIKSSRLKHMAKIAEMSDALKSRFEMEFDKYSDKEKFSQKNRDVAEMVNLCCSEAYDIKLWFKKAKLYRKDDCVKAVFPMNEEYLTEFAHNAVNLNNTLSLIDWLDDVRNRIKKFDNDTKTPTRRNKDDKQ